MRNFLAKKENACVKNTALKQYCKTRIAGNKYTFTNEQRKIPAHGLLRMVHLNDLWRAFYLGDIYLYPLRDKSVTLLCVVYSWEFIF